MFHHADVVCLCLVCILWQFSMLKISLTFTAGSVCLCGVSSHVVVLGCCGDCDAYVLLFVLHVCVL